MRFLLVVAAFEKSGKEIAGDAVSEEPLFEFPGGLAQERAFLLMVVLGLLLMLAPDAIPALTVPGNGSVSQMDPMNP
jgi:hypothetical protein